MNRFRILRLLFIFTIVFKLFFLEVQQQITYACEPAEVENWWYRQEYEFDTRKFPDGVSVDVIFDSSAIGFFFVSNDFNNDLFLIHTRRFDEQELQSLKDTSEIDPEIHDRWGTKLRIVSRFNPDEDIGWENFHWVNDLIPISEQKNQQLPGGVKGEIPAPQRLDLLFVGHGILYNVPYTITYSTNERYNPNMVVPPSSIKDRTIASIAIVEGIASSQTNEIQFNSIYGTAEVTVTRWFKGNGPGVIKVDSFGETDCDPSLPPNEPMILFLGSEVGENHYRLLNTWGYPGEQVVSPVYAERIVDTLGHPPIELISDMTLSDTLLAAQTEEDKPILSSTVTVAAPTEEGEGLDRIQNHGFIGIIIGGAVLIIALLFVVVGRRRV